MAIISTQFVCDYFTSFYGLFRLIFNSKGLSETSKKIIWKYLQLMLFTVVGSIGDKASFGDTAELFEGIEESDLQDKLNDTMMNLSGRA